MILPNDTAKDPSIGLNVMPSMANAHAGDHQSQDNGIKVQVHRQTRTDSYAARGIAMGSAPIQVMLTISVDLCVSCGEMYLYLIRSLSKQSTLPGEHKIGKKRKKKKRSTKRDKT